ncbi:MAG: hypothetical protein ISP49_11120 [Reyranella sp.]|jgi:hypothetical protein|nr:hypothetical protein [Reyranella sp.]MBL6652136.1 hypothetical protein [Reyranella sp.]
MIGAITVTALFALTSSIAATIGNFAMARDFPDVRPENDWEIQNDPLFDPTIASRYSRYKLTTNLFYYQSLVLWALLGVMAVCKLIIDWM